METRVDTVTQTVKKSVQDVAYLAVGVGVLGVHAAQARAGKAQERLEAFGAEVRDRVEPVVARVTERIEPVVGDLKARVEPVVDELQARARELADTGTAKATAVLRRNQPAVAPAGVATS
jgi:hypothetical protein